MNRFQRWVAWLATVTAVPVGRPNDGVNRPLSGALLTPIDKPWGEQFQELADAREAWRRSPLARRFVQLITAYVVGNGVHVAAEYRPLDRFLRTWWVSNRMDLRLAEWCDELTRSGELFVVLYTNPVDGSSVVRLRPAQVIDEIEADPEDYERELRYHEAGSRFDQLEGRWWLSPQHPDAQSSTAPILLHYAVNRPIGALRGESDLAPILPWMQRYSRWLEDRVRLNAGVRAFLWVVNAPARLHAALRERYTRPPEPGSIVIADEGETWTAVAPTLHANDAASDGRAIRWMITAGGPGTSLLDLGEGEDSNLATGQVMTEMRRRKKRRRQSYLQWLLADVAVHAWLRFATTQRLSCRQITPADVRVEMPDISVEDNRELASAAAQLASTLADLSQLTGSGPAFLRLALRWFVKFFGEQVSEGEMDTVLAEAGNAYPQEGAADESKSAQAAQTGFQKESERAKECAQDESGR